MLLVLCRGPLAGVEMSSDKNVSFNHFTGYCCYWINNITIYLLLHEYMGTDIISIGQLKMTCGTIYNESSNHTKPQRRDLNLELEYICSHFIPRTKIVL